MNAIQFTSGTIVLLFCLITLVHVERNVAMSEVLTMHCIQNVLVSLIIVFLFFCKEMHFESMERRILFFFNLSRAFWKENCSSVNYICLFSHENEKDGNRINS